jgi:anti-sigma regulatory factor (Ser/Thr protein kinase)
LEPVGEPIALEKVSLRDLRARASEAVRALGLDKDRGHDLLTAVGEAGMNAVVHAKDAVPTVGADPVLGVIQVWVEDRGGGIDLSRLPRAPLERGYSGGETPGFGHGFWLMLHTAERVWLLTGPSGTSVVLEMERTPPPPPAWLGGT